jgi:hypothetical protein
MNIGFEGTSYFQYEKETHSPKLNRPKESLLHSPDRPRA